MLTSTFVMMTSYDDAHDVGFICYAGQVSGLMCSYNSVNGVPSCANDWLLKDVARGEWGFDGYVTSDCDADELVSDVHHYHNDSREAAVRDILRAGTDNDCGGFIGSNAMSALNQSFITIDDVDERLAKLWRVRMRLGHFDQLGPLDKIIPEGTICTDYAIQTSMDGMIQSAALLKNDGKTLPLAAATAGTIAVIGPNGNYSEGDAGYYGPHNVCGGATNFWTAVDAVAKYASKVVSIAGVPSACSTDVSGIPAAVAMAKTVDTVVLVVGTDLEWAEEGHDAMSITFTGAQTQLIEQVSAAAKKTITVIYMTAVPLDISALIENDKIGAILHVGQPSVTILGAAELLFGKASPAGRTIQTIYPEEYQDKISIFDFNMRPGPSTFARPDCANQNPAACPRGTNPGRTHRFYTGAPVIPFGYGLSYSSFMYKVEVGSGGELVGRGTGTAVVRLDEARRLLAATARADRTFPDSNLVAAAAPLVSYTVNVTNTGSIDAADVVLGFLAPPGAGVNGVPLQTLFGFERIFLKAGETKSVYLYPALTDFMQVNAKGVRQVIAGDYRFHFGVQETSAHGMGYAEHTITTV
jgi:pre-mRNA-splicing factor SYF2/beta-D-xylosidase 4